MSLIKILIKKILPKKVLNLGHLFFAWYGAMCYGHPSAELLVIGITGTSGKSSTAYFLRQLLTHAGFTVGTLSTIEFSIAGRTELNDQKMTMLGRTAIQRYLRQMVTKGCSVAIIETTSEGFVQYRHRGIQYDVMLLTNLYPEHIESHGSFAKYMAAKMGIFAYVAKSKPKFFSQIKNLPDIVQQEKIGIQKTAVINANCEYAPDFLAMSFPQKITFGRGDKPHQIDRIDVAIDQVHVEATGTAFAIDGHCVSTSVYGEHQIMNITAAVAIGHALGVSWDTIQTGIGLLESVPGRVEFIPEAQAFGYTVIVDYAFEPVAMAALYEVVALQKPKRIIHVFGSTGGGRDVARRFTVATFVASHADLCVITDEDPYDDDPLSIMRDVAVAVAKTGKKEGKEFWQIQDRRQAIAHALQLAKSGDIVLITGKGSEQAMVVKGKKIPWDDRQVVREVLRAQ